jgi:hypothetical protein
MPGEQRKEAPATSETPEISAVRSVVPLMPETAPLNLRPATNGGGIWKRLRSRVLPSEEELWFILLALGAVFRFWAIAFWQGRGPMDHVFSDAGRHLDNGRHFLTPGPMGCSNAYFYQLFLHLVIKLTHEDKLGMQLVMAAQCVAYPLLWYGFARSVLKRRIYALRFATILTFLPTSWAQFQFFMTETALMPLLGGALWASVSAAKRRSSWRFLLAAVLWTCAALTRSVTLPLGILTLAWSLYKQRVPPDYLRRSILAVAAAGILWTGFSIAAQHSMRILEYPTTMGDSTWVTVGWAAGTKVYNVTFAKPKSWQYTYGYSSPSFYISPFDPIYDWQTARSTKTFSFTSNVELHGKDLKETFWKQVWLNRKIMPRLIYENFLFLTFGHAWPESGKSDWLGKLCLQERWIWCPTILLAIGMSLQFMYRRRRLFFVPAIAVFMTGVLYASLFVVQEGRYRKPFEPLLFLAIASIVEARQVRRSV